VVLLFIDVGASAGWRNWPATLTGRKGYGTMCNSSRETNWLA
jgi:hypothetical protein